jgi:hypothetical protein
MTLHFSPSFRLWLTLIVITVVAPGAATGTTLRRLSLEELVRHSDIIGVGICEKTRSVWLEKKVYTIATIRVTQSIKGQVQANGTLEVYLLGGQVSQPMPINMHVTGEAQVAVNEEMVLFLEGHGRDKRYLRFVGMAQGKIPVLKDPKTGGKTAAFGEPIKGVHMVDAQGKPVDPKADSEPPKHGSLEGFLGHLQKIMREQAAAVKAPTTAPANQPATRPADATDRKGAGK